MVLPSSRRCSRQVEQQLVEPIPRAARAPPGGRATSRGGLEGGVGAPALERARHPAAGRGVERQLAQLALERADRRSRATSGSVSVRASPRSRSRTGPPSRSTCPGVRSQSTSSSLGAKRASRAPMTSGDSQSCSTMLTMLSMSFARRVGMIAVCGIGRPSGWRNSAVTANQSASAPTVAASKPGRQDAQPRRAGERPDRERRPSTRPCRATAHSSEMVPTWLRRRRLRRAARRRASDDGDAARLERLGGAAHRPLCSIGAGRAAPPDLRHAAG